MKLSLALGRRENLNPQSGWVCVLTNLAMPGFGSLMGGRVSGYPQAVLTLVSLGLTMVFGMKFIVWGFTHLAQLRDPEGDPLENLLTMWMQGRWAFLGLFIFAFAWAWSLGTSLLIMRDAKRATAASSRLPPKI